MKFVPWFLAALTPFVAIAYNGYLGHAVVVMLTVGIFLGTLSLGQTAATAQVEAPLTADTASSEPMPPTTQA